MEFLNWFINPVKNQYADFEGRTTRQEFWMYILVYLVLYIALGVIGGIVGVPQIMMLFSLAVLVPNVAITARRLHDVNKSGWWQLIALIPVLGTIVLIVWLAGKAKNEGNQYGTTAAVGMGNVPVPPTPPEAPVADTTPESKPVEENKQEGFGGK